MAGVDVLPTLLIAAAWLENRMMIRQLLVHGGPILTMNPDAPVADAVLFDGERIRAVGVFDAVASQAGRHADTIDLSGRLACPGLDDAHAHIMGIGFAQSQVDLSPESVTSIEDIRNALTVRDRQLPPDSWLIGQGYDQASLADQRHPTRVDLDAAVPDRPVLLWRSCHHIAVVNTAALTRAGVNAGTPDTEDGTFDRDQHGELTGVLREAAATTVASAQPAATEDEIADALRRGGLECRRWGLTSATEAGVRRPEELRAYQRLWASGELPLRSYLMMIIDDTLDELISLGITTGFGDDWLRIGPAKLFSDGSIGGRTARLRQPYLGEEDNVGIWMLPPEEIRARVLRAHRAGFQVGIHAIGDAAIETILDAYEDAQRSFPRADTRHRIEHCSLPDAAMLDRIADLGVVPIPGTSFLHYMRPVYLQNLGAERTRYAYAMRTFAERQIPAAASSDAPVVPVNPLLGIQTMVSRADRHGDTIWAEEAISVEDALRAYTSVAAFATFSEGRKGCLREGYLGDMTVFGSDLRDVAPDQLVRQQIDFTIAAGEVVHQRT
ncbi:MAG TPA: amidohydrolase [Thermomicrobiales bacterium]|nr:amidohydrolase [Thermomicrobiales bacterium]